MRDENYAVWRLPLALLLIAAVTVAVYWPVLSSGFIDFDDDVYVTANAMVRQGLTMKGLVWAFGTFHAGNWHPLTWLSHMLDVSLFDLNPRGHHGVNLLFHTVNSLLLCGIFYRLSGFAGRSMVVALLFALHPLHVESVAWVAERKDVLSTLFWFLTILLYVRYAGKPSLQSYLPVVAVFTLGLLAKQMLVTLPLVLLLLDYWPLGRISFSSDDSNAKAVGIKRLLLEKLPLLLLSAGAAFAILRAHAAARALFSADGQSVLLHSGNALLSYIKYIRNMFWPADLALFYPFEASAVTPLRVAGAIAILLAVTLLAAAQRQSRPYLLFGWLWYLVTLLPVIGFVRVGGQALADRYTYIPLVGLFVMLVWFVAETARRWRYGLQMAGAAAAVVIGVLSVLTITQIGFWKSSYDLFAHALKVVDRNWLAHNNMGILLSQRNRNEEAITHFQESIRLNSRGVEAYRNLGNSLQMAGRSAEAVEAFRQAVWINPNDPESHYRLGYAYLLEGNSEFALQEYRQLLRLNKAYAEPLLESIRVYGKQSRENRFPELPPP